MCPTFFRFGLLVVVGNRFIKQIVLCTHQKVPTKRVILFKKIYNLDQPHAGELGLSTGTLVYQNPSLGTRALVSASTLRTI